MVTFRKLLSAKAATCVARLEDEEDVKRETHQVSLLRVLFRRAGGETSGFPERIDRQLSSNENLVHFGVLFDINTAPLSFGGLDANHAMSLVQKAWDDSAPASNQIYDEVPVGFLEHADPSVSEGLLHNLPHEAVLNCLRLW